LYKIPARTLFFGKNLIFMPECHSTNDEMLLLCQKESAPEGTLIITARQTAGRGQRGNVWETEPGKNLTFTILVKPAFLPIRQQFYLNIFVSLAIRDYLTETTQLKVQIKWPNDILLKRRKICGILIENQISGSSLTNSAIGIGLNVNQQQFVNTSATSVLLETGEPTELSAALDSLLHFLEARYMQLRSGKFSVLRNNYLENLYGLNEALTFSDKSGVFIGTIIGIEESGRLMVDKANDIVTYDLKEIRYVGEANKI
jgi:BirA family transcriptional regulator, biotin operon repressor / biotin---[acetyl-CoA-carboxylase] ligase